MDKIKILAEKLLNDLENITSGDKDLKNRLQGKMKKIINLNDAIFSSESLKDQKTIVQCHSDIIKVYNFFLNSPDPYLFDKAHSFFEE